MLFLLSRNYRVPPPLLTWLKHLLRERLSVEGVVGGGEEVAVDVLAVHNLRRRRIQLWFLSGYSFFLHIVSTVIPFPRLAAAPGPPSARTSWGLQRTKNKDVTVEKTD